MKKIVINICLFLLISLLLTSCVSSVAYKDSKQNMQDETTKKDLQEYRDSHSETLIHEIIKKKKYISILSDKSLKDVLSELEILEDRIYFLKTNNIIVPKSRLKIRNISDLKNYLSTVVNKSLFVKKTNSIYTVQLLSKSQSSKNLVDNMRFTLTGDISVEELLKLITVKSSFEFSFGKYITSVDDFKNSIVFVKSKTMLEAIKSLSNAKSVYMDIDYDQKVINIRRYKDIIIELNIPIIDLDVSMDKKTDVTNQAKIMLFDELDKMISNILSEDKLSSYHIDKGTGLIFVRSSKPLESSLRRILKSYEQSFARETTIVFERIELVLNKSRKYGIADISSSIKKVGAAGVSKSFTSGGFFSLIDQGSSSLFELTGTANNKIGKVLNYSKNLIVLKNNIPVVQTISRNTDYIKKITTSISENGSSSVSADVDTIEDGTSLYAMAKISRDKVFLNLTPNISKLIKMSELKVGEAVMQLPEYKYQSYNISKDIRLGERVILGSIIVHDDAEDYSGILPVKHFAIGGVDSKSFIRREIVYIVTVQDIKGF